MAQQSEDAWLQGIAGSNRDAIAARMSPAEITKAQGLVTDWTAKHGQ